MKLAALAALSLLSVAWGEPGGPGEAVFQSKCTVCHTIGEGIRVGPDLKGVHGRRDEGWLSRMVKDPGAMQKSDSIARQLLAEFNNVPMTNQNLTDAEVTAVLAYIREQSAPAHAAAGAASFTAQTKAEPKAARARPAKLSRAALRGRALFWGKTPLAKGAPACGSCHTAGQRAVLLGGTLGPDLTGAFDKFGEAGLAGILAAPPYPTMVPIFAKRGLTPQEQQQMKTYLKEVGGQPSRLVLPALIVGGTAGVVVLFALAQVLWRRRLGPVREALVWRRRPARSV